MPRSQGTSRKGKPKKEMRAVGMGRALEKSQKKRYKPKMNGSTRGEGGMISSGAQSIGVTDPTAPSEQVENTKSILELDDLTDFIGQAEMANREFESEKERFVVLDTVGVEYRPEQMVERTPKVSFADDGPLAEEGKDSSMDNDTFRFKELSVPRRPKWDTTTTPTELEIMERDSFLSWRRSIAKHEEEIAALMSANKTTVTPFEKNLNVWRQLWRVMERSDVIVLIVDGRNPLFYLSSDLRTYATEELGKPMLVIVNKSDYLTVRQREMWHGYLRECRDNVEHVFFSAFEEQKILDDEARVERMRDGERDVRLTGDDDADDEVLPGASEEDAESEEDDDQEEEEAIAAKEEGEDEQKTKEEEEVLDREDDDEFGIRATLTREQLLDALPAFAKRHNVSPLTDNNNHHSNNKVQYGMVGFPNVGKSSVINVLVGSSKHTHGLVRVGVASQPGKTKHFQTLHIADRPKIMLCDCPGLVFPSFVSSTADLIAAGVYPIAQMRDYWPVVELICKRIPREVLNAHYGIALPKPSLQDLRERGLAPPLALLDDGDDTPAVGAGGSVVTAGVGGGGGARLPPPTAEELLGTYCVARSLLAPGSGVPDYQRASRVVIRDYAEGKLLYCHCPPPPDADTGTTGTSTSTGTGTGVVAADDAEFQRETLLTAFRNTRKLKDKLGDRLRSSGMNPADPTVHVDGEAAIATAGGNIDGTSDSVGQDDEAAAADGEEDALDLLEDFDGLGIEDDLDILDVVGGFADDDDGVLKPNGGKRGKAHKKIQKWGKKGRKDRNKDPYGCHSEPNAELLSGGGGGGGGGASGGPGLVVNAGKYTSSGYTRPDYSGARGAVQFQGGGKKSRSKKHPIL